MLRLLFALLLVSAPATAGENPFEAERLKREFSARAVTGLSGLQGYSAGELAGYCEFAGRVLGDVVAQGARSVSDVQLSQAHLCVGYFRAFADILPVLANAGGVCGPVDKTTPETARALFLAFVKDHPSFASQRAMSVAVSAWMNSNPCAQ